MHDATIFTELFLARCWRGKGPRSDYRSGLDCIVTWAIGPYSRAARGVSHGNPGFRRPAL